jgi:tetratricopeptide (TPR) repeat protein
MARKAAAGFWSQARAWVRAAQRWLPHPSSLAAALVLIGVSYSGACRAADAVKGEAMFSASGGYARLVLKLARDVPSDVTTAGSILVIRFAQPVDIPVDKLPEGAPDYINSARRDPDGSAIRLSLARRVTVNTMTAGERVFVDLLPDSWNGPPPSLPQEVVRELAERARAAERALRLQRAEAEAKRRPTIRVRTSVQPTFVRFVFEMQDGVGVSSVLNDQKLTLKFNAPLTFDLADAKEAAPPNIASISQKIEGDAAAVEMTMIGDVDVHSFREEKNYVIDVAFQQALKPPVLPSPAADASHAPATAAPATAAPAPAAALVHAAPAPAGHEVAAPAVPTAKLAEPPAKPRQAAPIVPPTSETIAREANIELKPETAPMTSPVSEPPKAETPMAEAPKSEPPMQEAAASEAPAAVAEPPQKMPAAAVEPAAEAKPAAASGAGGGATGVVATRSSEGLNLTFSFALATPAAMFRRADAVWLVFDSPKPIDVEPIRSKGGSIISDVSAFALDNGRAIRIRLNRPQLPSLTSDDEAGSANWTVNFSDMLRTPSQPLVAIRNIADPSLANVTVPLAKAGRLHRLLDPDAGDTLMVVTAAAPVRGFIKRQDFVELSLLESVHGVAIRPNSDDITAEITPDKVLLGRPGGLTLSPAEVGAQRATSAARPVFDPIEWSRGQEGNFIARQDELIVAAGAAESDRRIAANLELARFYMSRAMYHEAKGVLDLVLVKAKAGLEDPNALVMRSVANSLIGRPDRSLKDLNNPVIGGNYDSQLWKALAYARQEKWADAREKFKNSEVAIPSLPTDLQRIVLADAMRASLEVKDFPGASKRSSELDVLGVPPEMKATIAVLRGWLAEGLGHDKDAVDQYKLAVESPDRAAAAEGKLRDIALKQRRDEISQPDALRELETLQATWRGDGIEVRTQQMLERIYADAGRYGEAFAAARIATRLQPNSEAARQCQDAASALFVQLFLGPKGDDLQPIDALGMFYENRELTPIGRRGDEMIRRLADRLVAVDLLDQAAELLQYQVDKRLEGAARAQVAAKLAMVYLTNRKPDRAISALRSTRIADLSGELRQQRLLLEARAQSDVGRHDLALDIISNITGREAIRLRSDIYWAARRWREASEQIELYYGDRWRDFKPLNSSEKGDVIRAVVGYALAEDAIGLVRFREKYAPLMSGEADRTAFDTASRPAAVNSAEFSEIAKMAAKVDTLDGFLREMKSRFPDATARAPLPPGTEGADPVATTGSLPRIIGLTRADAAK